MVTTVVVLSGFCEIESESGGSGTLGLWIQLWRSCLPKICSGGSEAGLSTKLVLCVESILKDCEDDFCQDYLPGKIWLYNNLA